jgi:hypothetical protein
MHDKNGRSLPQNRIDVGLVQKNGNPDKSVGSSDLQLLLLPITGRRSSFNAEDCTTGTPHHGAKSAFCLRQTGHVLSLPTFAFKAERPAVFYGRRISSATIAASVT